MRYLLVLLFMILCCTGFANPLQFRGEICFNGRNHSGEHTNTREIWVDLYADYKLFDEVYIRTMFENHSGHNDDVTNYNRLERAYLDATFNNLNVIIGRYGEFTTNEAIMDRNIEQVKVTYGKSLKFYGWVGQNGNFEKDIHNRVYSFGISKNLQHLQFRGQYWKYLDQRIYNAGITHSIGNKWEFTNEYMRGVHKTDGDIVTLSYGKMNTNKQGSWKVWARYFNQPSEVFLFPTYDCSWFMDNGGYKGPGVGIDLVPVKNTSLSVYYFDTESKDKTQTDRVVYSEFYYYF